MRVRREWQNVPAWRRSRGHGTCASWGSVVLGGHNSGWNRSGAADNAPMRRDCNNIPHPRCPTMVLHRGIQMCTQLSMHSNHYRPTTFLMYRLRITRKVWVALRWCYHRDQLECFSIKLAALSGMSGIGYLHATLAQTQWRRFVDRFPRIRCITCNEKSYPRTASWLDALYVCAQQTTPAPLKFKHG